MPGVVILIKFLSDHFDSQVWLDASDTCRYTEQKKKLGYYNNFARTDLLLC